MKRIVYVLSALAIMLSVTGELSAQQRGNRGDRGDRQGQGQGQGERQRVSFSERQNQNLKILTDSLDLTEDQVKKIKVLNNTYESKFNTMREDAMESGDREGMRDQMRTFMDTYNKDLKALLTEEQQVKFDKLQENRRNRRSSQQGDRSRRSSDQRSRGSRGNR